MTKIEVPPSLLAAMRGEPGHYYLKMLMGPILHFTDAHRADDWIHLEIAPRIDHTGACTFGTDCRANDHPSGVGVDVQLEYIIWCLGPS